LGYAAFKYAPAIDKRVSVLASRSDSLKWWIPTLTYANTSSGRKREADKEPGKIAAPMPPPSAFARVWPYWARMMTGIGIESKIVTVTVIVEG
jgi:hypothetical protein